jgi:hypothetical protein
MQTIKPQHLVGQVIASQAPKKISDPPSQTTLQQADVFTTGGQSYYSQYKDVLGYRLNQATYLDHVPSEIGNGVCRAASMHWLRRGFVGKGSLADSKKHQQPTGANLLPWDPRIASKVEKKWAPVQLVDDVQKNADKFGLVLGKSEVLWSQKIQNAQNFTTALYGASSNTPPTQAPLGGLDVGSEIGGRLMPNSSYLLTIEGKAAQLGGAPPCHVVALRTGPATPNDPNAPAHVQLFDPNVGEFKFDSSTPQGMQRYDDFMTDWQKSHIGKSAINAQAIYLTEVTPK